MNSLFNLVTCAMLATTNTGDVNLSAVRNAEIGDSAIARTANKFRNWASSAFVMTDCANEFLGLPMLAKLAYPSNENYDYYLMSLRWNVPLFKAGRLLFHYKQVRFEGNLSVAPNTVPGVIAASSVTPRIVGIYPTNQVIVDTVANTTLISGTFDPEYHGTQVGSVSGSSQTTQNFTVQLPVMAGVSTADGSLRWSLYPTKNQRIMLGNRTVFVLLQVPKAIDAKTVTFDGNLRYALNTTLPGCTTHFRKVCSIDTRAAVDLDEFLTASALECGEDFVAGLKHMLTKIK